jgi:hypothetical protein
MGDVLNIVIPKDKRKRNLRTGTMGELLAEEELNHRKEATKPERLLPDGAR